MTLRSHSIQRPPPPPQAVTVNIPHVSPSSVSHQLSAITHQNSLTFSAQEFQAQSDQTRWRIAALLGGFLFRLYEYFHSLLHLGPIRAVAAIEDGDVRASAEATETQDGNSAMPFVLEANAIPVEGDELEDPITNFEGSDSSSEECSSSSSERCTSEEEDEGSQSDTDSSIASYHSSHSYHLCFNNNRDTKRQCFCCAGDLLILAII